MNRLSKRLLALVLALIVGAIAVGCGGGGGGGQGGGEDEPRTLRLGIAAGWTENIAVANLVKVLLEDEFNYQVETQTADLGVVFNGVGNGDLDAFQDMWLPNHASFLEEVEDDVEQLGPWYSGEVKFGIVAPSYMNITSIDQLPEAGVEQIVGIDPGAVIMTAITENTIPQYNLEGIELIQSSEAAMLAEVEQRYEREDSFAFIAWTPHWMNEAYDFVYLEDPKNTLVNPEGEPLNQAEISTITREGLQEDDPVAFAMLDTYQLNQEQTNTLEQAINQAGTDDPTVGVRTWLEENRDVVQPWIDAARQAEEQARAQ